MLITDVECYRNYFLVMFKDLETGEISYLESFPGKPMDVSKLLKMMQENTTVSFNGLSYDLPLIAAAIEGWNNEPLRALSNKIIKSKKPSYLICKQNNIDTPLFNHIDLIQVAPGQASLKLYGGRLNAPKMQDLPIEPDQSIDPDMREELRTYCINDLETTKLLFNTLKPQIDLRISMSEQYGIDLRSKSDAQIAEAVIKSELEKTIGRTFRPLKLKDGTKIKYQNPGIVSFSNPVLKEVFNKLLDHEFEFLGNGAIKLPEWIEDQKIKIGDTEYQMGIGGLHSCEKAQYVEAGIDICFELDVRGYYPSIILQQRLSPKTMGEDFLKVYQSMVENRNKAKSKMQEIEKEIESLKKQLNEMEE